MTSRSEIKKEVNEDLSKCDKQLLTDIYQEILHKGRPVHENIAHANKRLASLFVKLSRKAEKSTKVTIKLNKRLLYLTWVIVIFTAISIFVIFFEFPKISVLGNQRTNQTYQQTNQN